MSDRLTSGRQVIVGIDGGAAAGKTTFAEWLGGEWRRTGAPVEIVHVDHFYPVAAERKEAHPTVFDCDWARLRDQVLIPLRSGKSARFLLLDWETDQLKEEMRISAGCSVLVEGVGATRNELRDYYDLRIWLSCPFALRESRMHGRGDFSEEEIGFWLPAETRFFADRSLEASAHLVIETGVDQTSRPSCEWRLVRWSPPLGAR